MSGGFEPKRIASALRKEIADAAADENDWNAVERVTERLVHSMAAAHGFGSLLRSLTDARADPYIAAVLVALSGTSAFRLEPAFRINEVFADDEIVNAAAHYLATLPDGGLEDGRWAWTAIWNGWGQLEPADHFRILSSLIDRVPWDDDILWMIGDGPLSSLASDPKWLCTIDTLGQEQPKIQRIWHLVEVRDGRS
jgi:hypothetical protein